MSYVGKPYQPPGPIAPPQEATNSLGVVALVLGIMSVFLGCPLAIGALITGWVGMKREPNGMARAGFVIGLIMTIFNVVAGLVGLVFVVLLFGLGSAAAYVDARDENRSMSSGSAAEFPRIEPYGSPFGSDDMAPMPVSMPPMELPKMPDPYVPRPYIPPTPPLGMDPSSFPQAPSFGAPSGFGAPGSMPPGAYPPGAFPPGAFPPGLGPPTMMETLSPTPESAQGLLTP